MVQGSWPSCPPRPPYHSSGSTEIEKGDSARLFSQVVPRISETIIGFWTSPFSFHLLKAQGGAAADLRPHEAP